VRARKPKLPVIMRATASRPIVRCVPHESFDAGRHFVEAVGRAAREVDRRWQDAVLLHARPRRHVAPENAYAFHAMLRAHADVGELPPWPGIPRQLDMF
jgi:hypothetical protein